MRDISRVPLLSAEQEITLGRQVQQLVALDEVREELTLRAGGVAPNDQEFAVAADLEIDELQARIRDGRQAKERMVSANLRLVVSIAKNYTNSSFELADLIQEGTIGLVRGVEKSLIPVVDISFLPTPTGGYGRASLKQSRTRAARFAYPHQSRQPSANSNAASVS